MPANIQIEVWRDGTRVIGPVVNTSVETLRKGDEIRLRCPDDNQSSYRWDLSYTPLGSHGDPVADASAAVLDTPDAQTCKFTVDWDGPYLVRLVINRGDPATEDTKFVRARVATKFAGVKLVSAGERRTTTPYVPADASTVGWTNDMNLNLQRLILQLRRISMSGRMVYVDPNKSKGYKVDPVTNPSDDPTKTVRIPGTDATTLDTLKTTGAEIPATGHGDFSTIQDAIDWAYGAGRSAPVKWARPDEEIASSSNPIWVVIQPGIYYENLTFREHIHLTSAGPVMDPAYIPFAWLGLIGADPQVESAGFRATPVIIRPVVDQDFHGGHRFDAPRIPAWHTMTPMPQPVIDFYINWPVTFFYGISLEVVGKIVDPLVTVTGSAALVMRNSLLQSGSYEGDQGPLIKIVNPVDGTVPLPDPNPYYQLDHALFIADKSALQYGPQLSGAPVAGRCAVLVDSRFTSYMLDTTMFGGAGHALGSFFLMAPGMYTPTVKPYGRKCDISNIAAFNISAGGGGNYFKGLWNDLNLQKFDTGGGNPDDAHCIDWDADMDTTVDNVFIGISGSQLWTNVRINTDKLSESLQLLISDCTLGRNETNQSVILDGAHKDRVHLVVNEGSTKTTTYDTSNVRFEADAGQTALPTARQWPSTWNGASPRVQDMLDTLVRLTTPQQPAVTPPIPPAKDGITRTWTPTLNSAYSGIWGFKTTDPATGLEPIMARGIGRSIYVVKDGGGSGNWLPVQILANPNIVLGLGEVPHLLRLGADNGIGPTPMGIDVGFRVNESGHATFKVFGDLEADNVSGGGGGGADPIGYYAITNFTNPGGPYYTPLPQNPGGTEWPWTPSFPGTPARTIVFGIRATGDPTPATYRVYLPSFGVHGTPPVAWPLDGQMVVVKDERGVAGTWPITIAVNTGGIGGTTIDFGPSAIINTNYGSLTFYATYDGGTPCWKII